MRLILCAIVCAIVSADSELVFKNGKFQQSIGLDDKGLLTVPQHCRADACTDHAQRLLTLEHSVTALGARQLASEKAIQDLVSALAAHKTAAATDAELAGVEKTLQRAINNVAKQAGPKGEQGAAGAPGAKGAKGEPGNATPEFKLQVQRTKWCNHDKTHVYPAGAPSGTSWGSVDSCVAICRASPQCVWFGYRSDRYCEYWSGGRTCNNPHHQPNHDIYKVKQG